MSRSPFDKLFLKIERNITTIKGYSPKNVNFNFSNKNLREKIKIRRC